MSALIEYRAYKQSVNDFIRRRLGREPEIAAKRAEISARTGAEWRLSYSADGHPRVEVKCKSCGEFFVDGRIEPWQMDCCERVPTPTCRTCMSSAMRRLDVARQEAAQRAEAAAQSQAKDQPSAVLEKAGVPVRWRLASLDACTDLPPKLLADVQMWASKPTGTLTLMGIPGCGKTFVAAGMLRWMLETGQALVGNVRFIREHDLLDLVRSLDWYKPMKADPRKIPMLIYDDLGSARMDDKARSAIAGLLEKRHADALLTVLTTNLTMNEIGTHLDARIASRLTDDGLRIEFPRIDFRARVK